MAKTKNNMRGGPGGRFSGEKPQNFSKTLGRLIKDYFLNYKIQLFFIISMTLISTILTTITPKILGNATTEIFKGLISKISGGSGINFESLAHIIITVFEIYMIGTILSAIAGFIMTYVAQQITYNLRKTISIKISRLPMKFFDKKTNGELLSIVTNDTDTLSQYLNQVIIQVVSTITQLIGIVIMMISISWKMTLVSIIILPITAIAVSFIAQKSQKYFKGQQEHLAEVNGRVEETYSGHNIVKAFNSEEREFEKFEVENEELRRNAWKAQFFGGIMRPIMNLIGNIGYVILSILGGYFALRGEITVGNIQSFIVYNKQFNQPIAQIAEMTAMIQTMIAAAERVFDFIDSEEEIQKIENAKSIENLKGNVEFRHVHFGYDPNKIIIKDFNAKVRNGQKIAIVGPTGAGKTTIIKLLMRFYDLNEGGIYIDGNNINEFNRSDIRKLFGMVLQDTWLFSGTVRDNIKYGKPDATDSEIIEAAKAAHINHFIKTLPNGYDSEINEESSNISAGQKQLLTIARVILTDPKILILDEATSSIDTRTEIQIQKAMDHLMKGRTSFIIAHRLSTIKNADLILVMKHGDIVEQGNHKELLEKNGEYAKLYNSQFDEEEE